MTSQDLNQELLGLVRRGVHIPLPDDEFNELALRVFRFQCGANMAYGGFVARRGVDPKAVQSWEDIPFLPTRAFKSTVLVSGDPAKVERVFRTSGTTGGQKGRGEHHVLDLALYRKSLLHNFAAHLLPDISAETDEVKILCLLPSPQVATDSSLSFMMGTVVKAFYSQDSGFFVDPDGEIAGERFLGSLENTEGSADPVLVAGTAFAFVRWVELAQERGWRVQLPKGSRIMETGGYKGRSRELTRADLYSAMLAVFGVEERLIVNEYGMTELLSQFYEPVISGESGGAGPTDSPEMALTDRFHRGPPWVRTRVLNPRTLDAVPEGEAGVLAHMDLANLGSVAGVLSEDLGRKVPGGVQLLGRSPGSEPRGCSLAMEDFLASQAMES